MELLEQNFQRSLILKIYLKKSIIVIDNASYDTRNYNKRQENIEQFYKYNSKKVDLITIDKSNIEKILNYDICYVMGGSLSAL